jgi:hypothetical protein
MVWLASRIFQTDANCNVAFSVKFTNSFPAGPQIAATATDASGNTSEFSLSRALVNSPDSDGDGMPNDFETAFGLNPAANDAALDKDGDGMLNRDEYLAGTLPNDPASNLRLNILAIELPRVFVGFSSVAGKSYAIDYTDALPPTWTPLASGLAGTGAAIIVPDRSAGGSRFYRLRLEP